MELTSVTIDDIDGNPVELKVGDYVCFKSDVEQSGQITSIFHDSRGTNLCLYREHGFDGGYIGGQTTTTVALRDCWVE